MDTVIQVCVVLFIRLSASGTGLATALKTGKLMQAFIEWNGYQAAPDLVVDKYFILKPDELSSRQHFSTSAFGGVTQDSSK